MTTSAPYLLIAHDPLDFAFVDGLAEVFDAAFADHRPRITLDLADIWLVDAGTVRVLIALQARVAAAGNAFRVVGAEGVVRHVLEMFGPAPPTRIGVGGSARKSHEHSLGQRMRCS